LLKLWKEQNIKRKKKQLWQLIIDKQSTVERKNKKLNQVKDEFEAAHQTLILGTITQLKIWSNREFWTISFADKAMKKSFMIASVFKIYPPLKTFYDLKIKCG
jgi:hypothetical protein